MRRAPIGLLLLAACAQPAPPPSSTPPPVAAPAPNTAEQATAADTCGASRFQNLMGTPATEIDRTTLPPGARVIMPGMMVTMDFSAQRLNIRVGPDGKVASLGCF